MAQTFSEQLTLEIDQLKTKSKTNQEFDEREMYILFLASLLEETES